MGIHWANMSGGVVYQEPQNLLQEPFDRDNANSGGGIRVLSITASADPLTLLELSSSLDVSGSVNVKRLKQRSIYDLRLQGSGTFDLSWTQKFAGMSNAYAIPLLSSSDHESQVLNAYLSGSQRLETTAVAATGTTYYSKQSRYQHFIYKMSASSDLSASYTNVNVGNGPSYSDDSVVILNNGKAVWINRGPSGIERGGRTLWEPNSGSYIQNTIDSPARFKINVPVRGKIVDCKVWVEFIHDLRGGRGPITSSLYHYDRFITSGGSEESTGGGTPDLRYSAFKRGLGSVVVALRSPNVRFDYAHPLWNGYFSNKYWYDISYGFLQQAQSSKIPEIFYNTYLLWSGHTAELDLSASLGFNGGDGSSGSGSLDPNYIPYYAEFDSDIDMRTIFTDSSRYVNPRNISPLRINGGTPKSLFSMSGSHTMTASITVPYQPAYPSPSYFGINAWAMTGSTGTQLKPHPTGSNFPWFWDTRIPPGYITIVSESIPTTGDGYVKFTNPLPWYHGHQYDDGSVSAIDNIGNNTSFGPLPGWLTGDGGGAASGEFLTSGIQIGPPDIQPVYPLLDDVTVEKVDNNPYSNTLIPGKKYVGFRPGLRGTQCQGTWELMIATAVNVSASANNLYYMPGSGLWFRQWRLELVIDQGEELGFNPQSQRRYKTTSYVFGHPSRRKLFDISGSNGSRGAGGSYFDPGSADLARSYDFGTNEVFSNPIEEYGRTIGITDNTASNLSDFAVFTRLTGTLADRLTGSGQAALNAYLNNEFGTPYIPISSGSSVTPSLFVFEAGESGMSRRFISDLLEQKTLLKKSHNLQSVLSRNSYLSNTLARRSQILVDLDISEAVSVFSGSSKLPS